MLGMRKYNFPPINPDGPVGNSNNVEENRFGLLDIYNAIEAQDPNIFFGELGDFLITKILKMMTLEEFVIAARGNKVLSVLAKVLFATRMRFRQNNRFFIHYNIDKKIRSRESDQIAFDVDRDIYIFRDGRLNRVMRTLSQQTMIPTFRRLLFPPLEQFEPRDSFPYNSNLIIFCGQRIPPNYPDRRLKAASFSVDMPVDERIEKFSSRFCYDYVTILVHQLELDRFFLPTHDENLLNTIKMARGKALIFPERANVLDILPINSTFKHLIAPKGLHLDEGNMETIVDAWLKFERVTTFFLSKEYCGNNYGIFGDILKEIFELWKREEINLKQLEVQLRDGFILNPPSRTAFIRSLLRPRDRPGSSASAGSHGIMPNLGRERLRILAGRIGRSVSTEEDEFETPESLRDFEEPEITYIRPPLKLLNILLAPDYFETFMAISDPRLIVVNGTVEEDNRRFIGYLETETNGKMRYCLVCEHINHFYYLDVTECDKETMKCPGYVCLKKIQAFIESMGGRPKKKINYLKVGGDWVMQAARNMMFPSLRDLGEMILEELKAPYLLHLKDIDMTEEVKEHTDHVGIQFLYKFSTPVEKDLLVNPLPGPVGYRPW